LLQLFAEFSFLQSTCFNQLAATNCCNLRQGNYYYQKREKINKIVRESKTTKLSKSFLIAAISLLQPTCRIQFTAINLLHSASCNQHAAIYVGKLLLSGEGKYLVTLFLKPDYLYTGEVFCYTPLLHLMPIKESLARLLVAVSNCVVFS